VNGSKEHRYEFGEFSLEVSERRLLRGGQEVPLAPKVFDTLVLLVENAGHLVEKEVFFQTLWPGVFVGEDTLTRNISLLRKALNGSKNSQAAIITVPTRGYRFEATVLGAAESPLKGRTWQRVAAIVALVVLVGAIAWAARRRLTSSRARSVPTYRQLTFNSFENRVKSGAISPDGKFLAYSDAHGMYIKLLATGEARQIPEPDGLSEQDVEWEIAESPWLPDSTRFLVNALPLDIDSDASAPRDASVWIVSAAGGSPRKLRDNAVAYSVSPDGSLVSFGTGRGQEGEREIWVMEPSGTQPRKIDAAAEGGFVSGLSWTPDGKRLIYAKGDDSGSAVLNRDLQAAEAIPLFLVPKTKRVENLTYLSDGRLLYSLRDSADLPETCTSWTIQLDSHGGRVAGQPRQLAGFEASCFSHASVTADGKRIAFLRSAAHITSYLAELNSHAAITVPPKHFPLSESSDGICDWTIDSRNVIVVSNRGGTYGIYRQALSEAALQPLVTDGYGRDPHVTPDGKWVLYLGLGQASLPLNIRPQPVARVPISGGAPQVLFTAKPWSMINCARPPSKLCSIVEWTDDRKGVMVSEIDPIRGRGGELARFVADPNDDDWWVELSPDGNRMAVTLTKSGPIRIVSLHGRKIQELRLRTTRSIQAFNWAADGKGLFVVDGRRNGRAILYVGLDGTEKMVWEQAGGSAETLAVPSPDGRYLAMQEWTTSGNLWVMENF